MTQRLPSNVLARRLVRCSLLGVVCLMVVACADAAARVKQRTTKPPKAPAVTKPVSSRPATSATTATANAAGVIVPPAVAPAGSAGCDPIRVMPLGDSLTAFPDSYRGPLFRSLKASGWNVDFVGSSNWPPTGGGDPDGEGHGGYRIGPDDYKDFEGKPANLADNVAAWLAKGKPEVIVLNIGTNDVAAGGDIAARAPAKLTGLVQQIRLLAPTAQIVVGDLPPGAWVPNGTPETFALSKAAKAAADSDPTFAQFVPVFDRMRANGFDPTPGVGTTDNTHFTVSGGIEFAKVLEPNVVNAMQRIRRC